MGSEKKDFHDDVIVDAPKHDQRCAGRENRESEKESIFKLKFGFSRYIQRNPNSNRRKTGLYCQHEKRPGHTTAEHRRHIWINRQERHRSLEEHHSEAGPTDGEAKIESPDIRADQLGWSFFHQLLLATPLGQGDGSSAVFTLRNIIALMNVLKKVCENNCLIFVCIHNHNLLIVCSPLPEVSLEIFSLEVKPDQYIYSITMNGIEAVKVSGENAVIRYQFPVLHFLYVDCNYFFTIRSCFIELILHYPRVLPRPISHHVDFGAECSTQRRRIFFTCLGIAFALMAGVEDVSRDQTDDAEDGGEQGLPFLEDFEDGENESLPFFIDIDTEESQQVNDDHHRYQTDEDGLQNIGYCRVDIGTVFRHARIMGEGMRRCNPRADNTPLAALAGCLPLPTACTAADTVARDARGW